MADLKTEEIFDGTQEEVFQAIRQYDKYPEYIPGVTNIEVLDPEAKGSTCRVRYDLKFIKSFFYTLNMYEDEPNGIRWDLADSNLLKKSNGSWTFESAGEGKTKAVYSIEVAFSGFVPQKVVDQITKANLPAMMKGFQQLINDRKSS